MHYGDRHLQRKYRTHVCKHPRASSASTTRVYCPGALETQVVEAELRRVPRYLMRSNLQQLWTVLYLPQVGEGEGGCRRECGVLGVGGVGRGAGLGEGLLQATECPNGACAAPRACGP